MKNNIKEECLILFAVMFASVTGASFFGVSLNKIALIPLELYLVSKFLFAKKKLNRMQIILLIWYFFSVLSAFFGFFDIGLVNVSLYHKSMIFYIVQTLFIYIPILLLGRNLSSPLKHLKHSIVIVAEINAVWAILQFILWEAFNFDLNAFFFNNILGGLLGKDWTVWNYENGTEAIRVSGLNRDTAFLVMILVPGFIFTHSLVWKVVFFSAIVLSLSRTGIFAICLVVVVQIITCLEWRKMSKRKISYVLFLFSIALILFIVIMCSSKSIRYQISYAVFRILSIFNQDRDIGTSRHILYIPFSICVWTNCFSLLRKLIGVGPRCGGVALTLSEQAMKYGISGFGVWAIECDYAELLLGHGILGFIIYYYLFTVIREKKDVSISLYILTICVMGIMYNYLDNTFIQLVFLFFSFSKGKNLVLEKSRCNYC